VVNVGDDAKIPDLLHSQNKAAKIGGGQVWGR
jgi:hypothetical protein